MEMLDSSESESERISREHFYELSQAYADNLACTILSTGLAPGEIVEDADDRLIQKSSTLRIEGVTRMIQDHLDKLVQMLLPSSKYSGIVVVLQDVEDGFAHKDLPQVIMTIRQLRRGFRAEVLLENSFFRDFPTAISQIKSLPGCITCIHFKDKELNVLQQIEVLRVTSSLGTSLTGCSLGQLTIRTNSLREISEASSEELYSLLISRAITLLNFEINLDDFGSDASSLKKMKKELSKFEKILSTNPNLNVVKFCVTRSESSSTASTKAISGFFDLLIAAFENYVVNRIQIFFANGIFDKFDAVELPLWKKLLDQKERLPVWRTVLPIFEVNVDDIKLSVATILDLLRCLPSRFPIDTVKLGALKGYGFVPHLYLENLSYESERKSSSTKEACDVDESRLRIPSFDFKYLSSFFNVKELRIQLMASSFDLHLEVLQKLSRLEVLQITVNRDIMTDEKIDFLALQLCQLEYLKKLKVSVKQFAVKAKPAFDKFHVFILSYMKNLEEFYSSFPISEKGTKPILNALKVHPDLEIVDLKPMVLNTKDELDSMIDLIIENKTLRSFNGIIYLNLESKQIHRLLILVKRHCLWLGINIALFESKEPLVIKTGLSMHFLKNQIKALDGRQEELLSRFRKVEERNTSIFTYDVVPLILQMSDTLNIRKESKEAEAEAEASSKRARISTDMK